MCNGAEGGRSRAGMMGPVSEGEPADSSFALATVCKSDLVRLGLQAVLTTHPQVRLIGEAVNASDAEAIVAREKPRALIVVLESEIDVADLARKVRMSAPTIRIIAISDMEYRHGTSGLLLSGIDSIVLNIQPVEILLATVDYLRRLPGTSRRQERNDPTPSDSRETTVCQDPASPSLHERLDSPLTDREQEIALLVGQGLSNKDIADLLHISTITVRHHLTNLFQKLGINTRLKLLRWVHQKSLVRCSPPI